MKKTKKIILFVSILFIGLFLFNTYAPRAENPFLHNGCPLPIIKIIRIDVIGVTLPPAGIWICPEYYNNRQVITHELAHWEQYKQFGAVGFYMQYFTAWISSGFDYQKNWMEIEATSKEQF